LAGQIRADLELLQKETYDDEFLKLSERALKAIELTDNQSDAFRYIEILFDLSTIRPLSLIGSNLADALDIYTQRFEVNDINLWKPVFSFMWYNIRRPMGNNVEIQIKTIEQHRAYLKAVYESSKSPHLRAISLYIEVENLLVIEREIRVLEEMERKEAIESAKTLLRNYGNLEKPDKKNLRWDGNYSYYATGQLNELERLYIGAFAPDIQEVDLDNILFKLSDYRGKIVVLSFWGAWCGPCIEAIPEENALIQRYRDKPFVLVGINTDKDIEKARDAVKKYNILWRSFWNGLDGWKGNITYDWFVQGYPLYYVLDVEGRIHFKSRDYEGLEEMVAMLLSEL